MKIWMKTRLASRLRTGKRIRRRTKKICRYLTRTSTGRMKMEKSIGPRRPRSKFPRTLALSRE